MEFTIAKSELLAGLYLSQGIVERRTTMPILSNVLLEAAGTTLTVSATDHEIGVRRACSARVKSPGAVTASARRLYDMVRQFPDGDIVISSRDNSWIEVVAGRGRYRLVGLDPREFPEMPRATAEDAKLAVKVPADVLAEMLRMTSFAMSSDETRMSLNGILLEGTEDGLLRLVATDGHRLALISREVEGAANGPGVIVPRKAIIELRKILEDGDSDIDLIVGEGVAYAMRGPVEMSMRLVEGEFPDYTQVMPKKSSKIASVDTSALLASLRRVAIVSGERSKGVKLDLSNGRLELSTINPDVGEATEELEVDYNGDPVNIGFNARYLIDAVSEVPNDKVVEIGLNDDVSPGVICIGGDAHFRYIVMPMRL